MYFGHVILYSNGTAILFVVHYMDNFFLFLNYKYIIYIVRKTLENPFLKNWMGMYCIFPQKIDDKSITYFKIFFVKDSQKIQVI